MKVMRKIIEIDEELCDGCGQCAIACAEGAIAIIDGKARLVSEIYCDGLGACLGECPQGAIRMIEREADDFDPEAVEQYLKAKEPASGKAELHIPGACPSSRLQMFHPRPSDQQTHPCRSCGPAAGRPVGPVSLAGADSTGAGACALSQRRRSPGGSRLYAVCLSRISPRFPERKGGADRMPQV